MAEYDDDGKKFNEDEYFRKLGLTKAERKSPDKWDKVREAFREGKIANYTQNALEIRSADEWMQRTEEPAPEICRLFGDFWHEGELAILFADTGKGKSILAVQIGDSLASGCPIEPFEMDWKPQETFNEDHPLTTVLYLDFELSQNQWAIRYSGRPQPDGNSLAMRGFHGEIFKRGQIKLGEAVPPAFKNIGEFLAHSIRNSVREYESRILIIDNISWLNTSNINATGALALMQQLKALKEEENLSILVLAHTPKRPFARPLTVNDLAGSKLLANFADTMFAIGQSIQGNDIRYVKEIKTRSTAEKYGAANVAVARIEKPSNFVRFNFSLGFAHEREHLIRSHYGLRKPLISDAEHGDLLVADDAGAPDIETEHQRRQRLIQKCRDLHARGLSQREIAEALGISKTTVSRYLDKPDRDASN